MDAWTHYEKLIEEGNDPFFDPPALQEYMEKWDGPQFRAALRLSGQEHVLEIGVGTGRVAARVAPLCRHLTGIDFSPKTVAKAKENLSSLSNVTLICADFSEYRFSETFDVVYATLTLLHFADKRAFVSRAAALLNSGGRLCLSLGKDRRHFLDMGTRRLRVFPDTPRHIGACAESAGLRILEKRETEFAHILVFTPSLLASNRS